jgi:hypothetical protein
MIVKKVPVNQMDQSLSDVLFFQNTINVNIKITKSTICSMENPICFENHIPKSLDTLFNTGR